MNSGTIFDVAGIRERIGKIEQSMARVGFWNDVEEARRLNKEKSDLEGTVVPWEEARREVDYLLEFLELAQGEEDGEADQDLAAELAGQAAQVEKMLRAMEFRRKLGGEHDKLGAIVSINAGSGGTEAQDWAEMLLRMYLRWAESAGYRTEITDIMAGDEAGIKNVTFTVEGDYAYGYLRSEVGVHRLVRISPFDAGGRRHTSFASVFVIPAIDDEVVVELNEDKLRVDTYRASGAGGQHVNKTDSAVRLTYDYNGEKIVVQCQNERSQHKNRATAMKILRAKLYERGIEERRERLEQFAADKMDIGFGSQIRSYVLQPYRMIKDLRTGVEETDVDAVLDGRIGAFMEAYLMQVGDQKPGGAAQ